MHTHLCKELAHTKCMYLHSFGCAPYVQWEFQDPEMEVLYHISGDIPLHRPYIYIYMVGTSNFGS